jgi:hypothetical protein
MIMECDTCGVLFDSRTLPECGHVMRRTEWDAARFKPAANSIIKRIQKHIDDEAWDEMEDLARMLYRCLLARPNRSVPNSPICVNPKADQ